MYNDHCLQLLHVTQDLARELNSTRLELQKCQSDLARATSPTGHDANISRSITKNDIILPQFANSCLESTSAGPSNQPTLGLITDNTNVSPAALKSQESQIPGSNSQNVLNGHSKSSMFQAPDESFNTNDCNSMIVPTSSVPDTDNKTNVQNKDLDVNKQGTPTLGIFFKKRKYYSF